MTHIWIIGVCVLLGFLDMLLLSAAIETLFDFDQSSASLLGFALAAVGTASAFLWGRSLALHEGRKWWQHHGLWIWLALCTLFIAMRAVVMTIDLQDYPDEVFATVSSETLMILLLAVLYIGSGLAVRSEAKKIFDLERYGEWWRGFAAKKLQIGIAKKYPEAERLVVELKSFTKNYRSLDKQYNTRKAALEDAERATLSTVARQVLEDNPQLSPQVVDDILKSILAERQVRARNT